MFQCPKCEMKFDEQRRLEIHYKTHKNKKPKQQKNKTPDFDKPDFSQVM